MRRIVVAFCLLVVALATVTALLDGWALRNVLDRDRFADRASALLATPEARKLLADELAGQLAVAVAPKLESLGLPQLAEPDSLARVVAPSLVSALASPAVGALQRHLLLSLHDAAFSGVFEQGSGAGLEGSRVILDLRPALAGFTAGLPAQAAGVVAAIAPEELVLRVADVPQLAAARDALRLAAVGLPVSVAIGILAALMAVLAAARRSRAIVGVGLAVALGGLLVLAATYLAEPLFDMVVRPSLAASLAADVLREAAQDIVSPSLVVVAVGLAIVGLGLLAGAIRGHGPRRAHPDYVREPGR